MAFMNVGSTGKLSPHFSILKSQPHPHHIQLRYDHKVLILLHEDEVLEESVQELQLVYLALSFILYRTRHGHYIFRPPWLSTDNRHKKV